MKWSKLFSSLAAISLFFIPQKLFSGEVELHAHLFMKEGLSWFFKGDFNDPLQSHSWKDRFSSAANPLTLGRSGLDIVVATLYAHPLFTLSLKESIRRQVKLAQEFVLTHPTWILAKTPQEARDAIRSRKQVLILALEGAEGVLETEDDLKEFVDQDGIRIVTLLHLTDDKFGGVAFLKGFRSLSSPIAFLKNLISPTFDSDGVRVNPNGLSKEGEKMALSLIRHHVWIDLSHSSDASQKDLIPILMHHQHPLLYTHTVLRRYLRAERGITLSQLEKVAQTRGIIGLMPSEEMLEGTPVHPPCLTGIGALAQQYRETSQILGEASVNMGSDFNGGILHLSPSCNTNTNLDREGFWNIGQSKSLWNALSHLGASDLQKNNHSQRFLAAWDLVEANQK